METELLIESPKAPMPDVSSPQAQAWLAAAGYGRNITDWQIFRKKVALRVIIDKPEHEKVILDLCPIGASVAHCGNVDGRTSVSFVARIWPWEGPPWLPGFGPLLYCAVGEYLPTTSSSQIIHQLGGNP